MMELFRECFDTSAFGSHEMSIFLRPRPEPELYCSKRPPDILYVRPLLRFDENLWVVFMMRDPRDVIVSRHRERPDVFWCHLGVWKRRYRIARSLRDHPRFVPVRYEDLVSRPDTIQDRLEARMPFLRRTRRFSEWGARSPVSTASDKALGGVRPISDASVGAWKARKGRIVSQLQKHGPIHRELIELGYEAGDEWLGSLAGVAPDDTPSVYAESRRPGARFPIDARALGSSLRFHTWRMFEIVRYALGLSRRIDTEAT